MSTVISIENLWKEYRLGVLGYRSFHQDMQSRWARFRGRPDPNAPISVVNGSNPFGERIWALKGVSLEVKQGEVLGIIGRNGAGKSTLLKILSRITAPTKGEVKIRGRVASLLEVGTGFHPELTGRENVFLNGAILGMSAAEIRQKFDEIVDFSGVEQFIDTPVKRYSSGMSVRLAFAVAAHLEPEILIVDEVLAVGDAEFQKKCVGRMGGLAKGGRTIVFVSHNLGAITQLCTCALLLERGGQVGSITSPREVVANYLAPDVREITLDPKDFDGLLARWVEYRTVTLNNLPSGGIVAIAPSDPINIKVTGKALSDVSEFLGYVGIIRDGVRLLSIKDAPQRETLVKGFFEMDVRLPPFFLRPGQYSVGFGGDNPLGWIWNQDSVIFQVTEEWSEQYEEHYGGVVNWTSHGTRRYVRDS